MAYTRYSIYAVARNKKWKSTHNRIGRCLGYLHAEADSDRSIILWSRILARKTSCVWENVV